MNLEARSQLLAAIKANLNSRLFNKVFFLILKFIDKYNAIYNINKQRMTLQNEKNRQDTTGVQDVAIINELQKKKLKMNS